MMSRIFKRLQISLCWLAVLFLFSGSVLQAQIVIVDGDTEAEDFPDPTTGAFFEDFQGINPSLRNNPSLRWDVFSFGLPLFYEDGPAAGEVVLRQGALLDVFGGDIRGLSIEDFSAALIFGGNVEALDPGDGLVIIGDNANVGLGNYSSAGGSRFESDSQTLSRISPITTPSQGVIIVDGGRLTGGAHPDAGLSLGTNGVIEITGGTIDASFGDIAGSFDVSGGAFSNFSVDSVSGEVNILGTNLEFNNSPITETQTFDSSSAAGGSVTGNLADGNAFEFFVPSITGAGTVNIINDVSEFQITMENEEGSANGGAVFAGGVDVLIEDVTVDGDFESQAQMTDADELEEVLGSDVAALDFELASDDEVQHWDLDFSGQFINEAELVFGYDELGLDIPEEELAIFHFDEQLGVWESLEILEHDLRGNRIRVRTTSFSPFVLGSAASVPEPGSSAILFGMMLTLAIRRRHRR